MSNACTGARRELSKLDRAIVKAKATRKEDSDNSSDEDENRPPEVKGMSRRPKIIVAPVLMFVVALPESPEMSSRAGLVFNSLGAFAFCTGLRAVSILEWAAPRAGLAISSSKSPSPSSGAILAWMCFRDIDLGAGFMRSSSESSSSSPGEVKGEVCNEGEEGFAEVC